jgi:hypothetical protein
MYIGLVAPAWITGTSYAVGKQVTGAALAYAYECVGVPGVGASMYDPSTNVPPNPGASFTMLDGYRWIFLAQSNAVLAQPTAGQADVGLAVGQKPPSGGLNWLFWSLYRVALYLQDLCNQALTWTNTHTWLGSGLVSLGGAQSYASWSSGTSYPKGARVTSTLQYVCTSPGSGTSTSDPHVGVGSTGTPVALGDGYTWLLIGDPGAGINSVGNGNSAGGVFTGGASGGTGVAGGSTGLGAGVAGINSGNGAGVQALSAGTGPAVYAESGGAGPAVKADSSFGTGPSLQLVPQSAPTTGIAKGAFYADSNGVLHGSNDGSTWNNSAAAAGGFYTGWAGTIPPRYWRDSFGIVHLDGVAVATAPAGTRIFNLPAGFRPANSAGIVRHFVAYGSGGSVSVLIAGANVPATPWVADGGTNSLGDVITNAGNLYVCVVAGNRESVGSGPMGTGSNIVDSFNRWTYVGAGTGLVSGDVALTTGVGTGSQAAGFDGITFLAEA